MDLLSPWLTADARLVPPHRLEASPPKSTLTLRTPLPNPPPQGGREPENQWFELSNPTHAAGVSERLRKSTEEALIVSFS